MGWWSRLFGRRAAAVPPSRALPAPVKPEPVVAEPVVAEPEPVEEAGDISPARLDAALQRLREEHPEAPES